VSKPYGLPKESLEEEKAYGPTLNSPILSPNYFCIYSLYYFLPIETW